MKITREEQVRLWDEQERTLDEKMMRQLQQLRWRQAQDEKRERGRKR